MPLLISLAKSNDAPEVKRKKDLFSILYSKIKMVNISVVKGTEVIHFAELDAVVGVHFSTA